MGNTRKGSSPSKSKPRSKSRGGPRSISSSGKSPKKTPGKQNPSKSPSRKATPKKQGKLQNNKKVVSKTPTLAARSRSTSRGRKVNTAPAAPKQQTQSRSRSRSRTITNRKAQLATVTVSSGQQPERPSSSLSQFISQQQQGRLRSRGQSSSISSGSSLTSDLTKSSYGSSSRSPKAIKGQGVVKRVWNGATQKLRKVLSGGYWNNTNKTFSKTKKHFKSHWKQWLTAIMVLMFSYFAYKFSKELVSSVKQLSQTISDYAEEKRKIFGKYSEQARQYSYDAYENARQSLENAKNVYFSEDPPKIKPFQHVEKPTDEPSHQTTPPTAQDPAIKGMDKSKRTIET